MSNGYKVSNEIKNQIINRIKNEGISVIKAGEEHGVSTKTIYRWLSNNVQQPSIVEFNKIKKEKEELLKLVGELTVQLSSTQKKIS